MTKYARLDPATQQFATFIDLTDEQYAALQVNGKSAMLRLYVTTQPPTPSAAQMLVESLVIGPANATQTWTLRAKTPAELDVDAQWTERAALIAMVQNLSEDIALGVTAAPTTAAQAFVHIQELKRQMLRLNRAVRWVLKQQG